MDIESRKDYKFIEIFAMLYKYISLCTWKLKNHFLTMKSRQNLMSCNFCEKENIYDKVIQEALYCCKSIVQINF